MSDPILYPTLATRPTYEEWLAWTKTLVRDETVGVYDWLRLKLIYRAAVRRTPTGKIHLIREDRLDRRDWGRRMCISVDGGGDRFIFKIADPTAQVMDPGSPEFTLLYALSSLGGKSGATTDTRSADALVERGFATKQGLLYDITPAGRAALGDFSVPEDHKAGS